ncbi:S1C family serine protease, partial [Anaerorhabdus sp.]
MFESKNDKLINEIWNKEENPNPSEEKIDEPKTETVNVEPTTPTPPKQEPKSGKKRIAGIMLAAALVGGTFGFGGGYLALQMYPQSVIVQNTNTNSSLNNTALSSDNLSLQDIIQKAQPSVVEIRTETVSNNFLLQEYVSEGAGSGVIITSDGYIVTNNHVIDNASTINVTLSDGTSYPATLIGKDAATDLAVIKIEATNLTMAVLGNSDGISVGDTVVAIGNPLGRLGGSATDGIISALDREITIDNETMTLLQTNAAVNPGNSGGGLFNSRGELIGIVNAKSSGSDIEGLGFAIPVNDVKTVAEQLINDGYVSNRASMGVYLSEVTQATAELP